MARELAAEGWVVLIPDLFARGAKALCVAKAIRTMRSGSGPELDDLESARRWLAERPEVDGDRIGAIGFCMGGAFALLLAETGLYKVSAPFYGRTRDLSRACPVVASFGGRDASTRGYPERLTANLDRFGVPHDIAHLPRGRPLVHDPHAGRDGPGRPADADPRRVPRASARDAHRRIVAFFREHL